MSDAHLTCSDEFLARQAQLGQIAAFVSLFDRHHARLLGFLLRRTNREDAEDLCQEAFMRAWKRLDRYEDRWPFRTWLFCIGHRILIDHLRRKPRDQGTRFLALTDLPDPARSRSDSREPLQPASSIWEVARRTLSTEQHLALWLRYAEDASYVEIGRVLGRSAVSVRVMLHRARSRIAEVCEAGLLPIGDSAIGEAS